MQRLTEEDYERAAEELGCDVESIKSVALVESAGNGFDSEGRPVLLFERHLFRKYTHGIYNESHPDISGPPGSYGHNQYERFSRAFALNPNAAMMSASWGKFQILGANFAVCGYASVGEFVDAMKESEGRQLDAFCEFVLHNHLDDEINAQDWAGFARGYNGGNYRINRYDTKMARAYEHYKLESSRSVSAAPVTSATPSTSSTLKSPDSTPPPPEDGSQTATQGTQPPTQVQVEQTTTQTPAGTSVETVVSATSSDLVDVTAVKSGLTAKLMAAGTAAYGYYQLARQDFGDLLGKAQDALSGRFILTVVTGFGLVALAAWLYDRERQRAHQQTARLIDTAANKDQNTVKLK